MSKEVIPLAVRRHKLVAAVREALQGNDVIVGVSGGADSVALLLLCCAVAMQQSTSFDVVVAHINHGLREGADDDQLLVESLCETLGVRFISRTIEVQPLNGSLAAGAREARYEMLASIATKLHFNTITVAHHATDQLETMLMALCRGGGLRKLAGMAPTRALPSGANLVRPLLHAEKEELETICRACDVKWCDDPTNVDPSTPRGRLRRDVIPVLRQLWSAADRHAANASTLLTAAANSFDALVPEGTQWSRESLSKYPLSIIAAAVHHAVGDRATFETVQSIAHAVADENTDPRTFTCGGGCTATVTAHHVQIVYT